MAQDRKQLEALLSFIEKLGREPGNEWFTEELKTKYSSTTAVPSSGNQFILSDIEKLKKRISNIEKYLGLDFALDSAKSIIDYCWIEDDDVRTQLISDNREMMRYRYGTRSHKIDFFEFCKYAHFQAEMLLNYFYEPQGAITIESVKSRIQTYYKKAEYKRPINSVSDIDYFIKSNAFFREYSHYSTSEQQKLCPQYWTLDNVRKARNSQNHRGKENTETVADQYTVIYNEWLGRTPFDDVISAIQFMANIIKKEKPQWISATINALLPSGAFIKLSTGNTEQLPQNLFSKVSNKRQGDIIKVLINKGKILDLKN